MTYLFLYQIIESQMILPQKLRIWGMQCGKIQVYINTENGQNLVLKVQFRCIEKQLTL